jgi:hypothetical protein
LNIIHLTPNGAYIGRAPSVQTFSLIQDAAAHRFFFHVVVILGNERGFCFPFFFGNRFHEFFEDSLESIHARMLVAVLRRSNDIRFGITDAPHLFAEFFVVLFV